MTELEKKTSELDSKSSNTIELRVIKLAAEQLGVEEEKVNLDSSFTDDLRADSLDLVELVMALEQEFDCEIPDDVAEKIKTVADAVEYIKKATA